MSSEKRKTSCASSSSSSNDRRAIDDRAVHPAKRRRAYQRFVVRETDRSQTLDPMSDAVINGMLDEIDEKQKIGTTIPDAVMNHTIDGHPDTARLIAAQEDARKDPFTDAHIRDLMSGITVPDIYLELGGIVVTKDKAVRCIRSRRADIPSFGVRHETQLLRTAGRHTFVFKSGQQVVRMFPSCKNGKECIGCTGKISGRDPAKAPEDYILSALMYKSEFDMFKKTGTAPEHSRVCILCHRNAVQSLVLSMRSYDRSLKTDDNMIIQLYRNPVDERDGYLKTACLIPMRNGNYTGLVYPVARLNLTTLHWVPCKTGGYRIKQRGNVYGDITGRPVKKPIPVSHFRRRAKDIAAGVVASTWSQKRPYPGHDHRLRSLAHFTASTMYTASLAQVSAFDSYRCIITYDSMAITKHHFSWVLCEETMPDMAQYAANAGYWVNGIAAQTKNTVQHFVNKCIFHTCSRRKMDTVVKEILMTRDNLEIITDWILVAWLGNLRWVRPDNHAPDTQRAHIYSINRKKLGAFMSRYPVIALLLAREVFVVTIMANPALQNSMIQLMKWDACVEMMKTLSYRLRTVLHDFDLASPTKNNPDVRRFELIAADSDVPDLQDAHAALLAVKRTFLDEIKKVHYLRERALFLPMFFRSHPGTAERRIKVIKNQATTTVTMDTDRAMSRLIGTSIGHAAAASSSIGKSIANTLIELGEEGAESIHSIDDVNPVMDEDEDEEIITALTITTRHSNAMWLALCGMPHDELTLSRRCFRLISSMGAPPLAISHLIELRHIHDIERAGTKRMKPLVDAFAAKFPYTHALTAKFSSYYREISSTRSWDLPVQYVEVQLKALRESWSLKEGAPVPFEAMFISVCPACLEIRSVCNLVKGRCKIKNSQGYNNPTYNYDRKEAYCRLSHRVNTVTDKRCGDDPLVKVLALGRLLRIHGKYIMLCPQRGCGIAMEVDTVSYSNLYTERGIACRQCCDKIKVRRTKELFEQIANRIPTSHCMLCGRRCTQQKAMIYPQDIVLCMMDAHRTSASWMIPQLLSEHPELANDKDALLKKLREIKAASQRIRNKEIEKRTKHIRNNNIRKNRMRR